LFAPATSNTNQNQAPAQGGPALATNGAPAQAAGTGNSNSAANTAQTGATPAADVQVQLQALNAALPALGLTNAEIQQIDRIASLVGDFNPGAYANIINQFEALAQQATLQSPPAVASPASISRAGTSAGGSTSGGGFQVKEILVQFTGSQAPQNNPAGLQVTQVQFTLANGNGQTVQVQTQQHTTSATNPNQQTPQNLATAI
jgi:hypothetical protein